MQKTREARIEEHKRFMEQKATVYLKALMVDILKDRPDDVLDYMSAWCQKQGKEIKSGLNGKVQPEIVKQPSAKLPSKVASSEIKETPSSAPMKPPSQAVIPSPPPEPIVEKNEVEQAEQLPNAQPEAGPVKKVNSNILPSSDEEDADCDDEEDDRLEKLAAKKGTGKKKMGISAEAYGNYNQLADFKPPVIEKSEEQIEQIRKTLKLSIMFQNIEANDFDAVVGAMAVKNFTAGEFVIKQGDDGAELFIVGEGTLKCEKLFPGNDAPTYLKSYHPGEVFGELSLMYNAPRAASIISESDSVCFSLDRDTFNNIVKGAAVKRRNLYEEFLAKIDILTDLEPYECSKICDCLNTETFVFGDFVIKEGEEGTKFYLIMEGTGEALKETNGEQVKVFEYGPNSYFGELALLNNEKRKASIRVTSEKMLVASLDKNSFMRMLGPIKDILKRNSEKYEKYAQQIAG